MDTPLTGHELRFVRQFLQSASAFDKRPNRLRVKMPRLSSSRILTSPLLAPTLLALTGLVLASYATFLFVQQPTDHVAQFVLLPGFGGGFFLMLVAYGVFVLSKRNKEKAQLAMVLEKLLPKRIGA
jgi:hypothetical protein